MTNSAARESSRCGATQRAKVSGFAIHRSISTSVQQVIESAILPSEIEQLPDLEGYLKFASTPEWRRVQRLAGSGNRRQSAAMGCQVGQYREDSPKSDGNPRGPPPVDKTRHSSGISRFGPIRPRRYKGGKKSRVSLQVVSDVDDVLMVRSARLRLRDPAAPKRDQHRHQCGPEEDAYESE
jgi:hypothetical protein